MSPDHDEDYPRIDHVLRGVHGYGMSPEMETAWCRTLLVLGLLAGFLGGFVAGAGVVHRHARPAVVVIHKSR